MPSETNSWIELVGGVSLVSGLQMGTAEDISLEEFYVLKTSEFSAYFESEKQLLKLFRSQAQQLLRSPFLDHRF